MSLHSGRLRSRLTIASRRITSLAPRLTIAEPPPVPVRPVAAPTPRAPLYPAGAVEVLATIRPSQTPRDTYRGPSGRLDGPEETRYAAALAALRARRREGRL